MRIKMLFVATAALAFAYAAPAAAQSAPESMVSIYHVAPGQQVAFLKWMARQDEMSAAAGVAKGQLYVHMDGDSWDYVVVAPMPTAAQDEAIGAASRKMGINPARGGLELRKYISSHTDTITLGPITAAEYLASIGEK